MSGGEAPSDAAIEAVIRRLADARAPGTFCPSEVARGLAGEWRGLMPRVREVASGMAGIVATQGGAEVDARGSRGPIRLGLRPPSP